MNRLKPYLTPAIFILGVILLVTIVLKGRWWLGDRYDDYKYNQAQQQIAEMQKVIDANNQRVQELTTQIRELLVQAALSQQETAALKEIAALKGRDAAVQAQKTQEAFDEYAKDLDRIDLSGSDYDLCINFTCPTRQSAGFPCRPDPATYCARNFSREPRTPTGP